MLTDTVPDADTARVAAAAVASSGISQKPTISSVPQTKNIESRERNFLAYGEDFWFNRHTTAASLERIRREDLLTFHHEWVHPRNFIVSISGDFDRKAMLKRLDGVFAAWPHLGKKTPPVPQQQPVVVAQG